MAQDYYEILQVEKTATQDQIKKAYRALAKKHHPDRFLDPKEKEAANKKFQEIQSAYDVLGDEQKRKSYDAFGHAFVWYFYSLMMLTATWNIHFDFRSINCWYFNFPA